MASISNPEPPTEATLDSEVSLVIWHLHYAIVGHIGQEIYFTHAEALHHLATVVREHWQELDTPHGELPAPAESSDHHTVSQFFGLTRSDALKRGHRNGIGGFEIRRVQVRGQQPAQASLRLATVTVHDGDPDDPNDDPLRYRMAAAGMVITLALPPAGPLIDINTAGLRGLPYSLTITATPDTDHDERAPA
ncbi:MULTISPECIES: hypothetical protein [unclassified Crossiella]|uniref:hypothetical protein n=1 Tax=unclassified Crossiella TaxID=2620835 RepID=UPI0020003DF6|nr:MULTISPECIES: hypothetical protein [unclassified Crossiella]MCK2240015.1 hypothetical protein [Crossiella sp. S99.2]MCK2252723.1 hypothetical protein [Crossiella sp. S99.1]